MSALTVGLLLLLLVLVVAGYKATQALEAELCTKLRVLEVSLTDISGQQRRLAEEYLEVHTILRQIRDLNKEELQDRKEILQHENLNATNRVLQVRKFMTELEDAARRELEGLKHG